MIHYITNWPRALLRGLKIHPRAEDCHALERCAHNLRLPEIHRMTLAYYGPPRQEDLPALDSSSPSPSFLDYPLFPDADETTAAAASFPSHFPSAIDPSYCGPETDDYIISSRQSTPYDNTFSGLSDSQFMTNTHSPNPRLRVLQSTPSNATSSESTPPPMSEGSNWVQPSWNSLPDSAFLSPQVSQASQQQYNSPQNFRSHKRVSSDSSVGSVGPDSPYTQSSVYPHIVDPDSHSTSSPHLDPYDASYHQAQQFAKPLYLTPNALNASGVNPAFQNLNISGSDAVPMIARQNAMREAMAQQKASKMSAGQQDVQRSFGREGSMNTSVGLATSMPQLDRTVSESYQDELFDPTSSVPPSGSFSQGAVSHGQLLSPHRSVFNDRLQQANTARSVSPSTEITRKRSPFRDDSLFAGQTFPSNTSTSVANRINSAAQLREQQKMQEDARVFAQHHPRPGMQQDYGMAQKAISPKETLLDSEERAESAKISSLSNPEISSDHSAYSQLVRASYASGNAIENNNSGNVGSSNEYASLPSSSRRQTPNFSSSQQSASSTNNYTFMPPNLPSSAGPQQPSYPFIARRQGSSMRSDQSDQQAPEFPSTLTSMESTKSESGQEQNFRPPAFVSQESSSSQRSEAASPLPRPTDTSANAGTYTCVAPSCTARFDTSTKLQKHRRENHQNSPTHRASSPNTAASSSTSHPHQNVQAAANNVSRNNAPGPHKCERLNPSTGKPCNTIFSRSYDLTRHEDTIHNSRKQKVRCHLCTEEKTFSRNDALTRHMRVVHPDIGYPGRNRRPNRS